MYKNFIVLMTVMSMLCLTGCNFNTSKTNISTNKNSVPQTYEEWVAKNGSAKEASPKQSVNKKTNSTTTSSSNNIASRSVNTAKPAAKELLGKKIPDWVYENSVASDDYYDALNQYSNFIYYTYQDCPKGRKVQQNISTAISKAGVAGKFSMKPMMPPRSPFCHKYKERFSESQVMAMVESRQKDAPKKQRMWVQYGDGTYCIPYAKNGYVSNNACKCSFDYFLANCNNGGKICIINPRARLIVSLSPYDLDGLVSKLNELKNNW